MNAWDTESTTKSFLKGTTAETCTDTHCIIYLMNAEYADGEYHIITVFFNSIKHAKLGHNFWKQKQYAYNVNHNFRSA